MSKVAANHNWLVCSSVATAFLSSTRPSKPRAQWIIFAVGLIFAALWTWKKTRVVGEPPPYTQTSVFTVAFAVWAYATGGVVSCWPGTLYNPLTTILILVGFSLLSGLVTKP